MLPGEYKKMVSKATSNIYILSFLDCNEIINSITLSSVVSHSLEPESLYFNCSSKLEEGDLISLSLINYDNRGLAELSAKPHEEKYPKINDFEWEYYEDFVFPKFAPITFFCEVFKNIKINGKKSVFVNCLDGRNTCSDPSELLIYHNREYRKTGG